ncbi:hypothetical protein BGX30_000691 [Mortierella sp. GBA39]|nr:hypothetical protein BGX30_000691 [Mortierella sp. GBA39]
MTTSRVISTTITDVVPATTARDGGGGGNTPDPAKPTTPPPSSSTAYSTPDAPWPTFVGSDSKSNPTSGGSIATIGTPGGGAVSGGNITLRPGAPTTYRNNAAGTNSPTISGSAISGSMTGVVFAFSFLGTLLIGFVAGFLITKYTRLGGREGENEQNDELTEQLRLLTDTLGQQNKHLVQRHHYQHHRQHRSYLNEEKLAHATVNQAEFLPLFIANHSVVGGRAGGGGGGGGGAIDRLQPQSAPDHNQYQDWDSVGSPFMPGSPMVLGQPVSLATTVTPPALLPPDGETDALKGEWPTKGESS